MGNDQRQDGGQWESPVKDTKAALNLFLFFTQVIAFPVENLLRWGLPWGTHHLGKHAVLGVFSILLVASFSPAPDWMFAFFWLTLILLVCHRIRGWKFRRAGYECHSHYSGGSIFGGNEYRAKAVLEPGLMLAAGGALLYVDLVLGGYVMVAALCQSVVFGVAEAHDDARVRALKDARIEACYRAGQMQDD